MPQLRIILSVAFETHPARTKEVSLFKIALIQNQSEMAHYGYADARPLLASFGYDVTLFTADNIDTLGSALTRNQFDAVVFGSNALNDKTVRAETMLESFRIAFRDWLENGHGCLCLHQLRLTSLDDPTLGFLPPPLNSITAVVRPSTEKSGEGSVGYGSSGADHILLLYPNEIQPLSVQKNATSFKSLTGLYWHSWSNVNLADWEEVLADTEAAGGSRPLLVSAREPRKYRVVVSALTFDWQKQRHILQNILIYVVEGRHNTAILLCEDNRSAAFDYLMGTLESRRHPFKKYFIGQDHTSLLRHINNGVHAILVLGPFVSFHQLQSSLGSSVSSRVTSGHLKLIITEGQDPIRRFSIAGRERLALRLLQGVELRIQSELRSGYIDGSFWGTAETLQILEMLPETKSKHDRAAFIALNLANAHDRDGSYDEVFGVSCAFLWMRAHFLGADSDDAKASAIWIRSRISNYDERERALAYLTLSELGIINDEERGELVNLLNKLDTKHLSEIDLVVYLRVSLACCHVVVMPALVASLKEKQSAGAWVDLATTATAVTALIDALEQLRSDASTYGNLKSEIEEMVFRGVIHIQEALERSPSANNGTAYPWDGKASTAVKCIQAWIRFQELIDLPVHELVDALEQYDKSATTLIASGQALSVLEELKVENAEVSSRLIEQSKAMYDSIIARGEADSRVRNIVASITPLCILLYVSVSIIVKISMVDGTDRLLTLVKETFGGGWEFHVAFSAAIAAFLALPWKRWLGRSQ